MIYLRRDCCRLALKFGLCIDEKAYKKEMKRLKIDGVEAIKNWHSAATTHFIKNQEIKQIIAIVFFPPSTKYTLIEHYALLVHEGVHIWQEHKRLIGENEPSEEYEAYAMQHIALELMDAFNKLTNKAGIKFESRSSPCPA